MDIVITSDNRYMYCAGNAMLYKWDLEEKQQVAQYQNPEGFSMVYMVKSEDDKKMFCTSFGCGMDWIADLEKDDDIFA